MVPKFEELKDKVVVITGGGGVLGRTFAEALAEQGAKLAILDIDLDGAKAVASEIKKKGETQLDLKQTSLIKKVWHRRITISGKN